MDLACDFANRAAMSARVQTPRPPLGETDAVCSYGSRFADLVSLRCVTVSPQTPKVSTSRCLLRVKSGPYTRLRLMLVARTPRG